MGAPTPRAKPQLFARTWLNSWSTGFGLPLRLAFWVVELACATLPFDWGILRELMRKRDHGKHWLSIVNAMLCRCALGAQGCKSMIASKVFFSKKTFGW